MTSVSGFVDAECYRHQSSKIKKNNTQLLDVAALSVSMLLSTKYISSKAAVTDLALVRI